MTIHLPLTHHSPMPTADWSAELRLAEFDRLVAGVHRWVEASPSWPPFEKARSLWTRISPRLEELRVNLDRVLVVGVVGGTGTGKSTLLNALIGQRVCQAGDVVRPTTTRPVVLAHPDVETSFLQFDDCQPEIHHLAVPLLNQMILVDCPDPDTQDSDGHATENRNLEILRRVLPRCDVLLCTGTAQKYKTQRVADELLRHAPGRQAVFVQTHSGVDADITADWQRHLESQGFSVPQMFRIDSEAALERTEQRLPLPQEFAKLVDYLSEQLNARARHRILRANALDLLSWFLNEVRCETEVALPGVHKLVATVEQERARLFGQVRHRLEDQLRGNQGIWRARLFREVTLRWSWGPFAGFLRLLGSARSWLAILPALRARGLGPMLVTGGIGAGKAVADRIRESLAESSWLDLAELGISPGELAQSQSVLSGFARDAGIEKISSTANPFSLAREDSLKGKSVSDEESISLAARRLHQYVEGEISSAIQCRAARRAGKVLHGLVELLFIALPAVLLWRLAKNFFYEHLWLEPSRPLLGLDYLIQSALWIAVWGLLLRGVLAWQLQRGLNRELTKLVERLTPDVALGSLFEEFATPAATIHEYAAKLSSLQADVDRLRHELESAGAWQLGRLKT